MGDAVAPVSGSCSPFLGSGTTPLLCFGILTAASFLDAAALRHLAIQLLFGHFLSFDALLPPLFLLGSVRCLHTCASTWSVVRGGYTLVGM